MSFPIVVLLVTIYSGVLVLFLFAQLDEMGQGAPRRDVAAATLIASGTVAHRSSASRWTTPSTPSRSTGGSFRRAKAWGS